MAPIPPVMLDRRVDVGDVSPDDAKSLVEALNCGAQVGSRINVHSSPRDAILFLLRMIIDPHRQIPFIHILQGIQCDFDDGFCPAWRNVLLAVHNIALASRGELAYPGAVRLSVKSTSQCILSYVVNRRD